MAYNKKNKAYTIKRIAFISICIASAVIILSAGYMFYCNVVSEEPANTSMGSSSISSNKTVNIARVKLNLKQGDLLDASNAEMIEVPVELAPEGAITSFSKLNNMRMKRELSEKEFLTEIDFMPEAAVYEEGDRLIEHNFSERAVPAAVSEGSEIDIKLFIKGGEDYVVISKALVTSRNANLLSFYMDSMEQEFIKEAAAEGMLFAVQYVDASQKASEVTYVPLYNREN